MKYFKDLFLKQVTRATNIRGGDEIYFIFLRAAQVSTLVSLFYYQFFIWSLEPDWAPPLVPSHFPLFSLLLPSLILLGLCELCLRWLDKGSTPGAYLGIGLSLYLVCGRSFLLGLFGLFSFLNPKAQLRYLGTSPEWFKDFLSACKINFTKTEESFKPPAD